MKTRYFIVTDDGFGPDPIGTLAEALRGLFYGVETETGLVITVESEDARAIIERALAAANRVFVRVPVEDPKPPEGLRVDNLFETRLEDLIRFHPPARESDPGKETQIPGLGASTLAGLVHVEAADLPASERGSEPPAAAPTPTAIPDPVCEHCKQEFVRERAGQIYCKDPECKKDRQRKWAREAATRKRQQQKAGAKPSQSEESSASHSGDAVEALDEMIFEAPAEEADVDTTPENRGGEAAASAPAKADAKAWYVEDGPREGEWLTSHEMAVALQLGNFRPGQHVRHSKRGRHQIVKGKKGSKALKLKQLYGENAPRSVTL